MASKRAHSPMKLNDLVLRCYAEKDGDGTWFAMCLSLNMYARGDNFEQARRKLHSAIASYLKDALTKDAEYVGDLVPRAAPLYFWMRYAYIWLCVKVRDATTVRKFKEAFPLVPAV